LENVVIPKELYKRALKLELEATQGRGRRLERRKCKAAHDSKDRLNFLSDPDI